MLAPLSRQLGPMGRRPASAVADPRFVYDTFTDSNGVLLENHTGEIGATWAKHTLFSGTFKVQSNRIYVDGNTDTRYIASGVTTTANQDLRSNVYVATSTGYTPQIYSRVSPTANTAYYAWRNISQKKWYISRVVTGSALALAASASADGGYANGASFSMRFTVSGTGATVELRLYINDTLTLSYDDTHASRIVSGTNVGIGGYGGSTTTGWHYSDFEARSL